jgi:hypothetical protein
MTFFHRFLLGALLTGACVFVLSRVVPWSHDTVTDDIIEAMIIGCVMAGIVWLIEARATRKKASGSGGDAAQQD